jgi:acetylornithine deacetylase/succinyl-diaminopimelate desuccinylase-like protein
MSFNTEKVVKYCDDHFDLHIEKLIELVKIPSCSWDGFDPQHVKDSAKAVKAMFDDIGLENTEILTIEGAHPYIYADWLHAGADKPTVLLYAHHDVQPPMREELWKVPPFEPKIIGDRIYGRGTADDKAGIIIHVASIKSYFDTHNGKLPVNVKIIIEGEEEYGSPNLASFLSQYKEKLQSDVMILTDLANFDTGKPALTTSLRGLVSMDVELKALDHPLHSGMFGGPIPDPNIAMAKIIAGITDDQGRINIPEIYEMIEYISEEHRKELESLPMDNEAYKKQTEMVAGAEVIGGSAGVLEKLWRLPSFAINSIESGSKKTAGNVVMESCWAKFGLRIAAGMNPEKVAELMKAKIRELCPWGLELKITMDSVANAWYTVPNHPYYDAAKDALGKGYGEAAVYIGCGGTIPFVEPMSEHLGNIPALLVGVEDPFCNAHSENESLHLGDFKKAIRSQVYMFEELAKVGK